MKTLSIIILAVVTLASCTKKKSYCYQCIVDKGVSNAYTHKLIRASTDTSIICEASEVDISSFIQSHMTTITQGDSVVYQDCQCTRKQ